MEIWKILLNSAQIAAKCYAGLAVRQMETLPGGAVEPAYEKVWQWLS